MKHKNYLIILLFFLLAISCKKDKENGNNHGNLCDTVVININDKIEIDSSKVYKNNCIDIIIKVEPQILLIDTFEFYYFNIPSHIDFPKKEDVARVTITIQDSLNEFKYNWSTGDTTSEILIEETGLYWYKICHNMTNICTLDTFIVN